MTDVEAQADHSTHGPLGHMPAELPPPTDPLIWIGVYKFGKAVFMIAAASVVLHLVHRDVARLVVDLFTRLDVDPYGPFPSRLLGRLHRLNPQRMQQIAAVMFLYAALYSVQGIGLMRRRRWAEWLTLASSCLLVPVEGYEVFFHFGPLKLLVLLLNVAVIAYLAWRLRREEMPTSSSTINPI